MAVSVLDATPGLATSNTYITQADADQYFEDRLQSVPWSGEDADDKAKALLQATRRIDQERFTGIKTDVGQALKFPRTSTFDDDGIEYATNTIPVDVERATCELALTYLVADDASTDPLVDGGLEAFDSVKVGPIEVVTRRDFLSTPLPEQALKYLRPWLVTSNISARVARA